MYRRGSLNVVIAVLMGVVLIMGGVLVVISNRDTSMTTDTGDTTVRTDAELERAEIEPLAEDATALVLEYTGEVALTPADKNQLSSRVAAPIREYYAGMGEDKSVIKLLVSSETSTTYNVAVFHADQTTDEFILTKFDDGFDWWRPQCAGECVFTERFAQKYPQIAATNSN